MLSTAKLNATGIRWVSELADFNFKIRYRPGKVYRDADGLSRMPMDFEKCMDLCTEETSQEFIKATINAVQLQDKNLSNWATSFASSLSIRPKMPQVEKNSVSLKTLTSYRPS